MVDSIVANTVDSIVANTVDSIVANTVDSIVANTVDSIVANTVDSMVDIRQTKPTPAVCSQYINHIHKVLPTIVEVEGEPFGF